MTNSVVARSLKLLLLPFHEAHPCSMSAGWDWSLDAPWMES
jgi:hypothetical protein